jgi:hypothetical protein
MTYITLFVALAAGCASDLRPPPVDAGPIPDGGIVRVTSTEENGITITRVDAESSERWVYFDLDTAAEVVTATPETTPEWDLGFQRFQIKTNGGVSGSGGVEVAVLPNADFEMLTRAPSSGYIVDQNDSSDEGDDPDYAFLAGDPWYVYNPMYHTLSPREVVYVVRTASAYFKVEMTGYYDMAGTGGFPTFRWAPIEPPPSTPGITVDASDPESWTYVSVATGVVAVGDPATSTGWDLAFSETRIATNGGTSGGGVGAARLAPDGATFSATTSSPTIGFASDAMIPIPGPPGSGEYSGNPALADWFDYDMTTHIVSPKDVVFLVRTANGSYGKLRILAYADGIYTVDVAPVLRSPTIESSTVDASEEEEWVYFDFSSAAVIEVADPAASREWDLGLSRTRVRTNGGTSGPGMGGATDAMLEELALVSTATGLSFTTDAMISIPDPPGSGEFSGNAVLSAWYDYDETTRVFTPKNTVFVIRTADGFVKIEIARFTDGVYDIDWVYSGVGVSEF